MTESICRKCGELREVDAEDGRCYSCIFSPTLATDGDNDDYEIEEEPYEDYDGDE